MLTAQPEAAYVAPMSMRNSLGSVAVSLLLLAGCGSNKGSNVDGGSGLDGRTDGSTNPGTVTADPCNPVSRSSMLPRVALHSTAALAHQAIPAAPSNGSVNVSRNAAGKPTRIVVDLAGSADDYTDDLSYTSAGLLSRFSRDAAGSTNDYTDDYSYNSAGLISRFSHDAAGSTLDTTEDFSYSSAGRISRYSFDAAGSTEDVTEDFSYTSAGLISRFSHDAAGSTDDVTEDFSYTSAGRLSRWTYDAAGSNNDASLDVSYDAAGMQRSVMSNGARATGAVVRSCT